MLKKSDLIKMLNEIEGDPVIILSSDGEGNKFSPLVWDYLEGYYYAETTWDGVFHDEEELDEIEKCSDEYIPCIVLYPTN